MSYVNSGGDPWATIRDAATGTSVDVISEATLAAQIRCDGNANEWDWIARAGFTFDLSGLSGTVTGVTFNARCYTSTDNFTDSIDLVAFTPAANNNIATSDYDQFGSTLWATLALAAITTPAYNAWSFNATGIAAIQSAAGGVAGVGARCGFDRTNSEPAYGAGQKTALSINYADTASTTSDPYLEITYTEGGGGESMTPDAATGSVTAPTPSVSVTAGVTPAAASGSVTTPTPDETAAAGVTPAAATGSIDAATPSVSPAVSVTPSPATAATTTPTPGESATAGVTPAAATGSVDAPTPTPAGAAGVTPGAATGTVDAPTPVIATESGVTVTPAPATATVSTGVPTLDVTVSVTPDAAAGTVTAPVPSILIGSEPSWPQLARLRAMPGRVVEYAAAAVDPVVYRALPVDPIIYIAEEVL